MLLEREHELADLTGALSEARRSRGRVVLVEGPAGIGKTSLLRAASDLAAEENFTQLRARAGELERDFAYGCLRQMLEPFIARAPEDARERMFAGAASLSRPLFGPTGTLPSSPAFPPSTDTAFSMLHGLYWLLNNIADEAPVALLIDDLHWADTESLHFLDYLARRLDGLPVVVVASLRPGESVSAALVRLAAAPDTTVLRPRPLSVEATESICARRLGRTGSAEFTAACWEATGGNPFFLEALLREARAQDVSADAHDAPWVRQIGPSAVAQSVLLRLTEAPAAAGALVRAVAVLGDGASLAEAASLAGTAADEARRAADLLAVLEILAPGESLEFAHPIVREAVYADLGVRLRADDHARAERVLAAMGASEERIAAQIAAAEPAGDPDRVALLRRVADDALARGAPSAAVAWLGRALAEPPPPATTPAVLLELGTAELRVAGPHAVDHLGAAVELIEDPALLAMSARLLGNAFTWRGESDRAVETLDSAFRQLESANRELGLLVEADLVAHAQEASVEARAPAAERIERHRALRGATAGERMMLASLAFERARASESASQAAAHIEAAFADGRLLDEHDLDVPPPLYVLVVGLVATEALDLADEVLQRMLIDARRRMSTPAIAFLLAHQGVASIRRGEVTSAEADARTALDLLTAHDIPLGTTLALAVLIKALVEEGDVEAADHALHRAGFGDEIPPGLPSNPLLEARGVLRLSQGRTGEAFADLVEFGRRDEIWGGANPLASRWRSSAALALASMGDAERARQMALDDLQRAQRWGAAGGVGVALRSVALVGGGAASVDRLDEAVTFLEASPARLELARARVDLGAALRRNNRRADARAVLGAGLRLAVECGARALADRARTEIWAAGGRSSDPTGTGVQLLTASERRVAELAAQGQSNPEIAQALFVTRKTIETHLGSIYRKLAISGRGELRAALVGGER